MNFNLDKSIALLSRTPEAYRELFYGLGHDWTSINEGTNTWSAFDILGHLIHGEHTDWIPRARIILSDKIEDKKFESFDRFAQEKISIGKSIEELIEEFETLRKANIAELKSWKLSPADLTLKGLHPELGPVTLQQLLATWTIHDMNHLNQVSRVIVKHYAQDVGPFGQFLKLLQ